MNLYLFPITPSTSNGYGIAVACDYNRLKPQKEDVVVWYATRGTKSYQNDYVIERPGRFSRAIKTMQNEVNCEVSQSDIKRLNIDLNSIQSVFCGDVIFYRVAKALFPDKKITVRFHNCFARIKDRIRLIDEPVNLKFKIQSRAFYKLEKEIFQDKKVHKIFISEEDRNYYISNFGVLHDSETWGFEPNMKKAVNNRFDNKKNTLVYFGGIQSHKIDSVKWFINDCFIPLRKKYPSLEFHLWGGGTQLLDGCSDGVYGHGFYNGDDLPDAKNALYVNPDLIGGGVKIKLLEYFEKGASFLSTPFGYEGYSYDLVDNKHYFVVEKDKWLSFLDEYFMSE